MKLLRLRGRKVCDRLLRHGLVWKGKTLQVRYMAGFPRHPSSQENQSAVYVGTLASTKLDKSAVRRNRMRRRCREALRIALQEMPPGSTLKSGSLQLLLCPRSSSLHSPFEDIRLDIRNFLSLHVHGKAQ